MLTRVRLNRPAWNLRACTHFMKISLRLFKLDLELYLRSICNFSSKHKLQLFPPALIELARDKMDHLILNCSLFSFNFQTCLESSVSFSYLISLNDFL